jgi:hypothetical protein
MVVSIVSPRPHLGVRGESSTISVGRSPAEAAEAADAFAAEDEEEGGEAVEGDDGMGVETMEGGMTSGVDDDAAAAAAGLPAHTAPIRRVDATVDAAWSAAAGRAETLATSAADGRPDFGATTWGGEGATTGGKASGGGGGGGNGASLTPLSASKQAKVNLPQQLSWPWKDVAAAGAADPANAPVIAKRRVNMLKPLGGVGGKAGGGAERRERMRTAMDGRMEVMQRHLLKELERRRVDVDALAKAPLGSVMGGAGAAERMNAWATGSTQAAAEPTPPPAFGSGPGPAPPRIRKLREQPSGGEKRDLSNSELGWVRRLVSFVDSSPIYVPQEGASNTTFTEDRQWEQTVFPSLKPNRRADIQLLERWLEAMLADLSIELPRVPGGGGGEDGGAAEELGEAALWVYRVAFEEIRRQVELQCRDRASLLTRVWDHFFLLIELRSGMRYEDQLSEIHKDRHALKIAMDEKDAENMRLNEELDAIDDRHRDELLAAERSRASLARQMVELERKAKEEHVRALEGNKKLLEEIGVRLHREDTIARMRKEAEDAKNMQEATDRERREEQAAKERSMAAHDDTQKDLDEARDTIDALREQIAGQITSGLAMERTLAEKSAQLDSERMSVNSLDASLREAQVRANMARSAEMQAVAQCEAKERERSQFEAVHMGLEAELLSVRKAKGKIDVMYQKLVVEHTAAMERMKSLEDTLVREREEGQMLGDSFEDERGKLNAQIVILTEKLATTEEALEKEKLRAAALVKEINDVRMLAKELGSAVRSQADLARGILTEDVPIGIVDPDGVTGLPDSAKTDVGKGKELMKRVVQRLREAKREFDELTRAREVVRIEFENAEELRIKAERDLYEEKLRNEKQAREVKAAEEATKASKKEQKRLEDAMKLTEKTLDETRAKLLKEETTVTEMKVTYADYGETKKRFDKSTAELDRTRADLASCQEDKRKLQGNVEVLTAEIKKLEGSIGKNEAKIAEQQRQIDELTADRARIQKMLDDERIANEENVAGRAAEAALKKRHERDLNNLEKEKKAVEADRDALREQLQRMFKRVAIARLCMQGLGSDLPDDAPPVRAVEPNTYDAMQFIKADSHTHGIPVNMMKLKISLLASQCKKLRAIIEEAEVKRLQCEEVLLNEARVREQELLGAFAEISEGEEAETAKVQAVLVEIGAEREGMVKELAEMGAIRAKEDPRLCTYDKKFKTRKDCASQCNDALVQVWVERAQRLPPLDEDTLLDRRLVNRVIVEAYLKRIELVAKELEKMRAGVGVVSKGERFSGGAVAHDTVFDCVVRAALEEAIAPQLKVEGVTLDDSVNNFLASARHYAGTDPKAGMFCRFTAMHASSKAPHLNNPAFHVFAGFIDCAKRLLGVNWNITLTDWCNGPAAVPQPAVLDILANVYNTNAPEKVALYVDVLLPAVVAGKSGPGLDFEFFLASMMEDYMKGIAPVNAMEKPRRTDAGAGGAKRGGTAEGGSAALKKSAAADKWGATLGSLRAPSVTSASLAKGIS